MGARWNDIEPIYWQLKERTVAMILDGTLAEGDALPSVRTVASEMQLNPITVSKSYQALVDEGLVEKRRGLGMFVCEGARKKLLDSERQRFLQQEWPATLKRIRQLRLDPRELLGQVAEDHPEENPKANSEANPEANPEVNPEVGEPNA